MKRRLGKLTDCKAKASIQLPSSQPHRLHTQHCRPRPAKERESTPNGEALRQTGAQAWLVAEPRSRPRASASPSRKETSRGSRGQSPSSWQHAEEAQQPPEAGATPAALQPGNGPEENRHSPKLFRTELCRAGCGVSTALRLACGSGSPVREPGAERQF